MMEMGLSRQETPNSVVGGIEDKDTASGEHTHESTYMRAEEEHKYESTHMSAHI